MNRNTAVNTTVVISCDIIFFGFEKSAGDRGCWKSDSNFHFLRMWDLFSMSKTVV